MKKRDITDWTQKDKQQVLRPSGPRGRKVFGGRDGRGGKSRSEDYVVEKSGSVNGIKNTLCKAGLVACAGAIVAVLAKGVKNSDYYD